MSAAPTPNATDGWTVLTEPLTAWGSSPVWRGIEDRLYWLDTSVGRVWRLHVPSGRAEAWDLPQPASALVPARQGGWVLVLRDSIHHATQWRMPTQRLAQAPFDTRLQRFAAAQCDPWGRLWVGTRGEGTALGTGGALYCLRPRDRVHPELALARAGVGTTDGLAFGTDGRMLYRCDMAAAALHTLPLISGGHWPVQLGMPLPLWRPDAGEPMPGRPSAVAVDSVGRCWVALHEGARVVCLSPSGQVVAELPLPACCPTGLCFGGRDLRTLFVVTSRQHRTAEELASHPASGAVLAHPMPIPGLPPATYWD
ncbi:MAG: SMP-30/gluconolactonase/LRE family protein [Tepidimonas ignava]|uniref:SMP-30/gluconolactonase/LRE family protein n=1 Tax=Tepidimonas ignava TaxID=114249 RepID=UPI002A33D1AE|nr:SMP-30/gluconolactonase/LRE family protein [Tepidimonas ignava]